MSALPVPPVVEQEVLAPYRDPVAALDDIGIEHRCGAAVAAARAAVVADPDALSLTLHAANSARHLKRDRDEDEDDEDADVEDNVPDAVERHLLRCETAIAAAVQALRAERVCRASFIKTMEAFKALPEAESHVDMADARQAEAVDFFTRKVAFSKCRTVRLEVKENLMDEVSICEVLVEGSLRFATISTFNDACNEGQWITSFGLAASSGVEVGSYTASFVGGDVLASEGGYGGAVKPTKATVSKAMKHLPQESPLHALPWKAFGLLMQIASLIVLCVDGWDEILESGGRWAARLGSAEAVAVFSKAHPQAPAPAASTKKKAKKAAMS